MTAPFLGRSSPALRDRPDQVRSAVLAGSNVIEVPMEVSEYFAGSPLGLVVHGRVVHLLAPVGDVEVRVGRSQVGYRRRRGFAWLWLPGRYLARPSAELVLSVALGRHDSSPRFKEVAHPARTQWIHHLELHAVEDVDDEVAGWLREAASRAG